MRVGQGKLARTGTPGYFGQSVRANDTSDGSRWASRAARRLNPGYGLPIAKSDGFAVQEADAGDGNL